ncbi:hypothetical protein, partial [Ochrobactrum sp. J50]|uniref:hypothetical protein n=1 Tax=Ochrobactrum sp. J50 TaxID=936132 RepID=UPI001AEDD7AE
GAISAKNIEASVQSGQSSSLKNTSMNMALQPITRRRLTMPSKELIEEIAFIIRHDRDGSPEDTARDILEVIFAALQEPTEGMIKSGAQEVDWYDHNAIDCWRAMLAASALGEQSE